MGVSQNALTHLAKRQAEVDAHWPFVARVQHANKLWKSKSNSEGNGAFAEVRKQLSLMCIGEQTCNYCERNDGTDIEHIAPKSFFPERTFDWTNYLLACTKCNSRLKRDQMFVFSRAGSEQVIKLEKNSQPSSNELAFLNPREENPMDFMFLDLENLQFEGHSEHAAGTKGFIKMVNTVEILQLNDRALAHHRAEAYQFYKRLLVEYVATKNASNFDELEAAIHGRPKLDMKKPFSEEQHRIINGIQRTFLTADHPTVWQEMIRQRALLPTKIQWLFDQAPELITATTRS